MKGSNFLLDGVKRLFYKCQKISLKHGESYIDSPQWLKNNNNDVCFEFVVTASLNFESIGKHSERISKITPVKDQYKWKDINFPTEKLEKV